MNTFLFLGCLVVGHRCTRGEDSSGFILPPFFSLSQCFYSIGSGRGTLEALFFSFSLDIGSVGFTLDDYFTSRLDLVLFLLSCYIRFRFLNMCL
jgi:hypothetical protein